MGKRVILRGKALRATKRAIRKALPRFESYVSRGPDDECWVWTGGTCKDGYGLFWFEGRSHPAQRVAYLLYRGPIPAQVDGHHTCENAKCVNPYHIELKPRVEHVIFHAEKQRAETDYEDVPF